MLSFRAGLVSIFCAALAVVPAFAERTTHKSTASTRSVSSRSRSVNSRSAHKATKNTKNAKATAAATTATSGKARGSSRKKSSRVAAVSHKLHGQQVIDSNRVTEIQQALVREHYLNGEPTGSWDATTQAAMQKFQSDQGWQTKLMPDSRALKKLGLGPDYSTAINAEGSSFAAPPPVSTIPGAQASGFAAAARVSQ